MKLRFLFFLLLLATTLPAQPPYTVESVPDPKAGAGRSYVSNPDGILSEADVAALNRRIAAIEDSATAQVAVVIVASIGQENPKDFAYRLFQHWGIGQADTDNGLLIFSVMDQRRTEFETGYGLEAVLPDAICYRIGMQELVPYFREGQYGQGLITTIDRIRETLENPAVVEEIRSESPVPQRDNSWLGLPAWLEWYLLVLVIVHLCLGVWVLITLSSRQELYDKYLDIRKAAFWPLIMLFPIPFIAVYIALRRMMKRLRNQPRYSRVNGKPMHKLSEPEDDTYLEAGQAKEELLNSVDYDVWVTEDGDDVLVLRYAPFFSEYSKCPKCKYRTYSLARTRVIRHATYSHSGKKELVYSCKNCKYTKTDYQTIPQKQRSRSGGGISIGGGGSSGGGSWGGGSSGGGGAGVSW